MTWSAFFKSIEELSLWDLFLVGGPFTKCGGWVNYFFFKIVSFLV